MRSIVVSLVASFMLLSAGCLSSGDSGPFPAGQHADDLDWTAGALQADDVEPPAIDGLELVGMVAIETTNESTLSFPSTRGDDYLSDRLEGLTDERLGDGRVAQWIYLYNTQDGDRLVVHHGLEGRGVIYNDGSFKAVSPYLGELEGGEAIEPGWMDSDAAAERAAELDADWDMATQEAGNVVMVLHHPTHLDNPYWGMGYWNTTMDEPRIVLLDAFTGEGLNADDVFQQEEAKGSIEEVVLTPAGNEEVTLDVEQGYSGLALRIEAADEANPAAHVHAWLFDPEGNDASLDDTDWPDPIEHREPGAKSGTWTLEVGAFSDSDAANMPEQVQVTWCIDGAGKDPLGVAPPAASCL